MTLEQMEQLAKIYADQRSHLADLVNELQEQIDTLKDVYREKLRFSAVKCAIAAGELTTSIEANKHLFEKPRTRVLHGIKLGLQKGKGRLEWSDQDKVVARIKANYQDEMGILIVTTERPNKTALAELPVSELRRLGITVIETGDQVVVKSADSDLDRHIKTLLDSEQAVA